MKYRRQNEIIKIVREKRIKTHEQLIAELENLGYEVTQATISRDIKELGLIKTPSGSASGSYYAVPSDVADSSDKSMTIFSNAVKEIIPAMNTIVVKTYPGMAPAVAAAVDSSMSGEIVGSVAGDDTLIIVTMSIKEAQSAVKKLRKMVKS